MLLLLFLRSVSSFSFRYDHLAYQEHCVISNFSLLHRAVIVRAHCLVLQFAKPNRSPTAAEQALKLIARTTALNRPTLPIMQSAGQALPGTSSSAAAPGTYSPFAVIFDAALGTTLTAAMIPP